MTAIRVMRPIPRLSREDGNRNWGPTVWLFRYIIPIYRSATALDGVNFSNNTIWEGDIGANAGRYPYYKDRVGRQFISEAADLSKIQAQSYDFLLRATAWSTSRTRY